MLITQHGQTRIQAMAVNISLYPWGVQILTLVSKCSLLKRVYNNNYHSLALNISYPALFLSLPFSWSELCRAHSWCVCMRVCVHMLSGFSHVRLCATLWTVAWQVPLSMGFSRREYWSGLPCPPLGDLPNPGTEPASLMYPALAGEFFTTSTTWEAQHRLLLT